MSGEITAETVMADSLKRSSSLSDSVEVKEAESVAVGLSFLNRVAAKLNFETNGVELVLDDENTDKSISNTATMWLSANMVIVTFSLGALGVTCLACRCSSAS